MASLQPFARIRLIAADLDGTLAPARASQVSSWFGTLRRSLSVYRVDFTIATGRTLTGARPMVDSVGVRPSIPLIVYNGSVVALEGGRRLLRRETIPQTSLAQVLELMTIHPVEVAAYYCSDPSKSLELGSPVGEYVLAWAKRPGPPTEINGLPVTWNSPLPAATSICPSAVLIRSLEPDYPSSRVDEALSTVTGISVTRSGPTYAEIRPLGSDKAVGLSCVAAALNLDRTEVLALGDHDNDAEMLTWAGIGVTVAGASQAALASSDYCCRHGVAEGAVELLRLVKNARRYFPVLEE